MELTRYEHETGELFVFQGLAVNVDLWNGIKILCKRGLTLDEALSEWGLDHAAKVASYCIPNDSIGELAHNINDLRFEVWSDHYQNPGELDYLEGWMICPMFART